MEEGRGCKSLPFPLPQFQNHDKLTPGEETMIGALARQGQDGDGAACRTLSPLLARLHLGTTLPEVRNLTGFAFWTPYPVPATPHLTPETYGVLCGTVKAKLAQAYPHFAARL